MTTTIDYKFSDEGEDLAGFILVTESEMWTDILMEFASELNNQPEDYRFFIDLNILKRHIQAASAEMTLNILNSVDTDK